MSVVWRGQAEWRKMVTTQLLSVLEESVADRPQGSGEIKNQILL